MLTVFDAQRAIQCLMQVNANTVFEVREGSEGLTHGTPAREDEVEYIWHTGTHYNEWKYSCQINSAS